MGLSDLLRAARGCADGLHGPSSPATICPVTHPRVPRMDEACLSGARLEWSYSRPRAGSGGPQPARSGQASCPSAGVHSQAGTGGHRLSPSGVGPERHQHMGMGCLGDSGAPGGVGGIAGPRKQRGQGTAGEWKAVSCTPGRGRVFWAEDSCVEPDCLNAATWGTQSMGLDLPLLPG